MATTTTNYELTKAGYNDIPDIQTINDNMDTLDSSLVVGESNDDVMETITKTTGWTNAEPVTLGDKFQSVMTKISTMIKNLKWIYKFIGSTDISSIGDGTITNAISTLSSNKLNASDVKTSLTDTSTSHALSTASGKALNDAIASTNSALEANIARRRVFSFQKTLAANGYTSATVTETELGLTANEYINICSVHHPYSGSGAKFVAGIQIGYRIGDGNRSVMIDMYNSSSSSKTFVIQAECLTTHPL